jgi:Protein ChrB, N-terminal
VAWLVLTYRLSASAALKTAIRRKLTGIGAMYLANAVAVLPASPAAERALRQTRNTIAGAGDSAELLRAEVLEGGPGLIATHNVARDQEYGQILARCDEVVDDFAVRVYQTDSASITGVVHRPRSPGASS